MFPFLLSVPIIVANDYGLVIMADPRLSHSLDPVPVVQGWFDGVGCNYGIPHLMISAVTELYFGVFSVLMHGKFK
jgi:hypothetical protein